MVFTSLHQTELSRPDSLIPRLNPLIPCRRIEDKLDAKQLASFPLSLRCDTPPSAKRVPMHYPAWLVVCDSFVDQNIWSNYQLMMDRTVFYVIESNN